MTFAWCLAFRSSHGGNGSWVKLSPMGFRAPFGSHGSHCICFLRRRVMRGFHRAWVAPVLAWSLRCLPDLHGSQEQVSKHWIGFEGCPCMGCVTFEVITLQVFRRLGMVDHLPGASHVFVFLHAPAYEATRPHLQLSGSPLASSFAVEMALFAPDLLVQLLLFGGLTHCRGPTRVHQVHMYICMHRYIYIYNTYSTVAYVSKVHTHVYCCRLESSDPGMAKFALEAPTTL